MEAAVLARCQSLTVTDAYRRCDAKCGRDAGGGRSARAGAWPYRPAEDRRTQGRDGRVRVPKRLGKGGLGVFGQADLGRDTDPALTEASGITIRRSGRSTMFLTDFAYCNWSGHTIRACRGDL